MITMNTKQAAAAMGGTAVNGNALFTGFATDSRQVREGDLFLCIRGEKTDGHLYADAARKNGAAGFLCERDLDTGLPYIKVDSTVGGLQRLALHYRKTTLRDVKITAVTGSVGKTTSKEMTAAVLSQKFQTYRTRGNKNSETGLPITVLETSPSDKAAVVEMGMSNLGEIRTLSEIALPDIGIITNIGLSHIENLGSRENILRAKTEIVAGLQPGGTLVLNGDDDLLENCGNLFSQTLFYGIENRNAAVRAENLSFRDGKSYFTVYTPAWSGQIELPVLGRHNVSNALAAISAGYLYGLSYEQTAAGLRGYAGVSSRQKIYRKNGYTIFDDCYNASPASVASAAEVFKTFSGRKIAVLGDMLELGEFSQELHQGAGEKLGGIDLLVAYGNFAQNFAEGAHIAGLSDENIYVCKNTDEAATVLLSLTRPGDCVLFKASRGMAAEKVLQAFEAAI